MLKITLIPYVQRSAKVRIFHTLYFPVIGYQITTA